MATVMGNPWSSHGLIKTPFLEHDYQTAEITTDEEGIPIGPQKEDTTCLFEGLFAASSSAATISSSTP